MAQAIHRHYMYSAKYTLEALQNMSEQLFRLFLVLQRAQKYYKMLLLSKRNFLVVLHFVVLLVMPIQLHVALQGSVGPPVSHSPLLSLHPSLQGGAAGSLIVCPEVSW